MSARFLVFVKPGVSREGAENIIQEFVLLGFTHIHRDLRRVSEAFAGEHYEEHRGKPFFDKLIAFTASGPVDVCIFEGDVAAARALVGGTDPKTADPHTLRARYGEGVPNNAVHCSANEEDAAREVELWFGKWAKYC